MILTATTVRFVEEVEKIAPAVAFGLNQSAEVQAGYAKFLRRHGGVWRMTFSDGSTQTSFGDQIEVQP